MVYQAGYQQATRPKIKHLYDNYEYYHTHSRCSLRCIAIPFGRLYFTAQGEQYHSLFVIYIHSNDKYCDTCYIASHTIDKDILLI